MNEHFTRAPHRSSTSQPGAGPHAALMIDFDNVTMGIRSNLGQELRSLLESDIIRGKVSVQRAYADWRRYPQYIVPLSEASIDLIFAPAYGSTKKNATDIRLAIDALELVFTRPEIGTFILLSGDSDFSSLVLKLKEYGKYIIGVGLQESSSDLLVQNCDEYYSYNSLSGLTSAEDMETVRHDPWELAEKAVRRMKERNDVMRSDRLKQVMLELDQSFDEKELGFSKFNRFLAEASSRGLIRLHRIENGQYEVDLGKSAREKATPSQPSAPQRQAASPKPSASRKPAPSKEPAPKKPARSDAGSAGDGAPPSGVPTEAASLRKAYHLLSTVVGELSEAGEPVRDSEVKREMLRRDQGFDEAEYGFRKFSRFLRQAHDEEVVDLTTDDNGNYHLGPAGSTSAKAPSSDGAGRAPSGAPAKKKRERKPEPSRPERQPESRAQEAPQPEP
ncbi:MAG: NYN domain-containing protein, partial [Gemmatimonadota bacterium]